jgi:hypothetical protein
MKLDFFARRAHYLDHLVSVYRALPAERRGRFTIPLELVDYARQAIGEGIGMLEIYNDRTPRGEGPILVCSYGDIARAARNPARKILHMEHGTGHSFGGSPYPAGRKGKRDLVSLFLAPNEYTARLIRSVRKTPVEVIGTPKMDEFVFAEGLRAAPRNDPPVIAIAFHWGDKKSQPPEKGSAFEHYREILPVLRDRYRLIGHGHPLATDVYRQAFEDLGIEWVPNFRDVLQRADVYVNDLSSTLYEFLLTGKPVVVLNAPWFRRSVHWGIRFWDYSDVGLNVGNPGELIGAIDRTLDEYGTVCAPARRCALEDLYPYAGASAQRAADVITACLETLEKEQHVPIAE